MNVVVLSDVVLFLQVDEQYIEQYMVDEQYIADALLGGRADAWLI